MDAVRSGDIDALRAVYAEDVAVWHSFDGLENDREQNLRTLRWIHRHVPTVRYDEIRVGITEDGFVQQHVMRAEEPAFEAPCMLRAWCSEGKITRIEEYLDSAHTKPLTDLISRRSVSHGESDPARTTA
jgi:ketosteroid isomerase-like protein